MVLVLTCEECGGREERPDGRRTVEDVRIHHLPGMCRTGCAVCGEHVPPLEMWRDEQGREGHERCLA